MSADNTQPDESPQTQPNTTSHDSRGRYDPEVPQEWRYEHSGHIDPQAFASANNVICAFVPLAAQETNRFELLQAVQQTLTALPGTAKHITRRRIGKREGVPSSGLKSAIPTEFFLVHNAYPCPRDVFNKSAAAGAGVKFANPRYLNHDELDSVTDDNARIEWLDCYAHMGMHKQADIINHFGFSSRSSMGSFLLRHPEFDWRARYQAGLRRRGRTWKLLEAWGYDRLAIAEAFGVNDTVVEAGVRRYAADFEPPVDPTESR